MSWNFRYSGSNLIRKGEISRNALLIHAKLTLNDHALASYRRKSSY